MSKRIKRKVMSFLMTLAMIATLVPSNMQLASASEVDHLLATPVFLVNLTGTDLIAAGMDKTKVEKLISGGSGGAVFYLHMETADEYSYLATRSGSVNKFDAAHMEEADYVEGSNGANGASNKYLLAKSSTQQPASGNVNAIQLNSDGEPVGTVGTGNYAFPQNGISTNKIMIPANWSLSIRVYTTNTTATPLGITFTDGTSVTLKADGTIQSVNDFTAPKTENTSLDKEIDPNEINGDDVQPWLRNANTHRANLKSSIDYLTAMDKSAYTDASVTALDTAIDTAEDVYNNSGKTAKEYWTARNALEYARAKLVAKETGTGINPQPFTELSKSQVIKEMGAGINLGNTMDGHSSQTPSETSWQGVVTTKEIIKSMHDAGFNTIRIPVTWGNMIVKDAATGNYSIRETWMNRVQEVVDYATSQDMYVIINIHHDGVNWSDGWLNIGHNDIDAVMEKFAATWTLIADRFKDYDEHLIFESMNEITCSVTDADKNGSDATGYDKDIMRNFNQLFMNTVRATGGNNSKRWLTSVSHFAGTSSPSDIVMPTDPANSGVTHQMFATHIYQTPTTLSGLSDLVNTRIIGKLKKFTCPVYIGECGGRTGTDNTTATGYNDIARAYQSEILATASQSAGVCPVVWDQGLCAKDGIVETSQYQYWNRAQHAPVFQNVTDALMRGVYGTLTEAEASATGYAGLTDINNNYNNTGTDTTPTEVKEIAITKITAQSSVEMQVGDVIEAGTVVEPANHNDVLLWQTDDDSVVTVANGKLKAKGIGSATVTVYAQNSVDYGCPEAGDPTKGYKDDPYANAVKKEIQVTVTASDADVTEIQAEDTLKLAADKSALIDTTLVGAEEDALTFASADSEIATVNSVGRVFGKKDGKTTITITASNGVTKTVNVSIEEEDKPDELNVALFMYYNDTKKNYYTSEYGPVLSIQKEGQYTVTFDCATDLSAAAKAAGITDINGTGSIFMKDVDVHSGEISQSPVYAAKIRWDSVKVNDTALELTTAGGKFFNPIKANTLDTGNPVNTWDGSVVKGITESGNAVTFDEPNPTKMTITFTITDLCWKSTPIRTHLQNKVDYIDSLNANNYTKVSWDKVIAQYDKAKTILADDTKTDAQIKTQFNNLYATFFTLVQTDTSVNLETAIAEKEAQIAELKESEYSEASWAALQNALETAKTALASGTVEDQTAAQTALEAAMAGLTKKGEEPLETPTPTASAPVPTASAAVTNTPVPSAPAASAPTGVNNGDLVSAGTANYKVTSTTAKTVEYKAPAKKTITSASIPDTISVDGVSYQVTSIAASAFSKCAKLKSVTIGKKVKKINAKAFYGCKSLKTIKIKSTVLASVGSKAIYGINKKAKISCPSKKLKAYKKLFKAKTGYKKTMKIRK